MKPLIPRILLILLILPLALILRLYNINWDQFYHLHPDERMITMVAQNSPWPTNPHFFAYGSFPIYLLKFLGVIFGFLSPIFSEYTGINLAGRLFSALFDLGTLITLYFLGKKLFDQNVGLLTALLYALAVLPIQLSHFYAVDTLLTFFITLTLYQLVIFYNKPSRTNACLIGLLFGLALATKFSALILLAPIILTTALLLKYPKPPKLLMLSLIPLTSLISLITLQPFMFLDFSEFSRQINEQNMMTKDASIFPYTLQYVGITPYFYELKNIFLWGLGPILASLAFIGTLLMTYQTFRPKFNPLLLILFSFFWIYFAVVGHFAIGFMRYMFPLYPLFCLFAAYVLLKSLKLPKLLMLPLILLTFIWPLTFMHIYTQPNTRVLATSWINQNIPSGTTIATEHWDDGLPLDTQNNYKVLTLTLYDPDTPQKWAKIDQILKDTSYIMIASNRLYVPLQKLTDCNKLPPGKCYKQTADYYQKLFSGELGFKKVAEFSIYPTIPILNYPIDDSQADESFTVYDHPKVMIFKKI